MSYPEKYRIRTLEYRREGHTLEQTSKVFKVNISTIREWEKRLKEEGTLAAREIKRPFKKIDPEKLEAVFIRKNVSIIGIYEIFSRYIPIFRVIFHNPY